MVISNMPKIALESGSLSDLERALRTEWLITNGLGGYASSTILGINTRKYHGLLVAALNPPVDRRVLLTKLEEEIHVDDRTYYLGANEVKGGFQHIDCNHLTGFALNPLPTFTYRVGDLIELKKTLFMPRGRNATVTTYEVSNGSEDTALMAISPLVNFRHFHSTTERDKTPCLTQKQIDHGVTVQPSTQLATISLISNCDRYALGPGEWKEIFLRTDASRGDSCFDVNYKPGYFECEIDPGKARKISIVAVGGKSETETSLLLSTIHEGAGSVDELYSAELVRRDAVLSDFQSGHSIAQAENWLKWLVQATDSFIVERASIQSKSVIAGYHWFEDWGRDSLISLPGLALVTGRFGDAKRILLTFEHYCQNGLIPNRFPDGPEDKPIYNTVDATLWYINAVLQYLKYTNDFGFVREKLLTTLESIIENHVRGTMFNIHMDADGLIAHGPQLTWMDAAPFGNPVTPRDGKAVEIQALWYNALKTMQLLAIRFGQSDKASEYLSMAEKTRRSFVEKFWNPQKESLFDVVQTDGIGDNSLRPNQVLAASLDFVMLDPDRAEQVIDAVGGQLWGGYGLRTLSKDDPR
ncbi:MAG TPA: amylo-alpha-1,6-glucosidase, partial [Candidatus Bathyarchaeia archaeon]|nr:amylo-alpha-1,6-glucosidase [Candidatus Bathyarchaeia archaeon]